MDNGFVIIDLETQDLKVETGIYQVGLMAVNDKFEMIEELEMGIVEDESKISFGYGFGYENICNNKKMIDLFKSFLNKYKDFKLIAHNSPFDKRFLVHYNWLQDYEEIIDSITICRRMIDLDTYSLDNLIYKLDIQIDESKRHQALEDCEGVRKVLQKLNPNYEVFENVLHEYRKRKLSNIPKVLVDNLGEMEQLGNNEIIHELNQVETICFTGRGEYDRKTLTKIANELNYEVKNSVTKDVTLLVVGDLTIKSNKVKKAIEKGIRVMSAEDFINSAEIIKNVIDELAEKYNV